jgi:hypothetical protein
VLYCSFVDCMLPDTAIALAWLSFSYWSPLRRLHSYFSLSVLASSPHLDQSLKTALVDHFFICAYFH